MSPHLVRGLLVAPVLALVLSACGASASGSTSGASAGSSSGSVDGAAAASGKTLDFSADAVGGGTFAGQSLAGKPAVLWFWAPWCPTCRRQVEGVSALAAKYGDQVGFVGVGSLDDPSAIEDFAAGVPTAFPELLDPDGAVWRHFGVVEQSTYVVLDANGTTVSQGYLDDAELADVVSGLAG